MPSIKYKYSDVQTLQRLQKAFYRNLDKNTSVFESSSIALPITLLSKLIPFAPSFKHSGINHAYMMKRGRKNTRGVFNVYAYAKVDQIRFDLMQRADPVSLSNLKKTFSEPDTLVSEEVFAAPARLLNFDVRSIEKQIGRERVLKCIPVDGFDFARLSTLLEDVGARRLAKYIRDKHPPPAAEPIDTTPYPRLAKYT